METIFSGTQVYEVRDLDLAFPTPQPWFTPLENIPVEFRNSNRFGYTWECAWGNVCKWSDVRMLPSENNPHNVHSEKVMRMVFLVGGTYGIKHEHKYALISYILGSFFTHVWVGDNVPEELKESLK